MLMMIDKCNPLALLHLGMVNIICIKNIKLVLTSFYSLAAATQVKFNRKSEYLIASAHDKDVKIWDLRVSLSLFFIFDIGLIN